MFIVTFIEIILAYHIVYISLQESPVAIQHVIVGHVLYDLLYIRAFLIHIVSFVDQLEYIVASLGVDVVIQWEI